jgi:Fe(3+) dicitrate transport protein
MKPFSFVMLLILLQTAVMGQIRENYFDSLGSARSLDSVILLSFHRQNTLHQLPSINGTYLFAGKKSEVILMTQLPADVANKTGRQVFAKIPGVFVYDMDGSGNQVNIAARGLDPHRGWEFNIRKDGIITNSDMYGYPASHYSMPLESIERIELVRGTGSLQYGAQFGGMLNYISKQGDTSRKLSFENVSSAGSYHLLSSYNAIGGKSGTFRYYAYLQKKSRDGYRDNEHTNSEAEGIILNYDPTARLSFRAEWARSVYLYRIPGPLTDSMFLADPTQATRSRNYFSPDIHIPSLTVNWQASPNTRIQFTSSAVLGKRNSVLFDKPTNVRDTINAATLDFNNRQVDIDVFNSHTHEIRLLQQYRTGKRSGVLVTGIQYMNNDLHRRQLGKGTTGSDYDLSLVTPGWGRDIHLKTKNIAFFAENKLQLTQQLSLNAGVRIESGRSDMSGKIIYYPDHAIPLSIKHRFPLFGLNLNYVLNERSEIYAGWAQSYHPMLFKDLIPGSLFEKVDSNIRDARGYNAEAGFRGSWKFLSWDVNGFVLRYNDRFGTLAETDNNGNFYTFRTNIGNSVSSGVEILLHANWLLHHRVAVSIFTSTAFIHARYISGSVKSGNSNVSVKGNKVESAPSWITRNGITVRYSKFSISGLYSYTSESFSDAINTRTPLKTTGAVGLVPAYGIIDLSAAWRSSKSFELRLMINNLLNKQYFTKRPSFYPGPGVWPSDGRNLSLTCAIRL